MIFRNSPEVFDLIITDMAMPKMSGYRLSEEINKIRPEIPVLLCSGLSSNWEDGKKLAPGVKGFIVKPIIMKELSRKIREILDSERSTVYV